MSIGGKIWVGIIGLGIAVLGAIIAGFGEFEVNEIFYNLYPLGVVLICLGSAVMALSLSAVALRWYKQAKKRDCACERAEQEKLARIQAIQEAQQPKTRKPKAPKVEV